MSSQALRPASLLGRVGWTLRRFGLTPRGVVSRVSPSKAPRVLCICIPKAGTHLLERALCLHPAFYRRLVRTLNDQTLPLQGGLRTVLDELRPGQVLMSHLPFSEGRKEVLDESSTRSLFLIRDPRDIVVSSAMYIAGNTRHALHDVFRAKRTLSERLRLAIDGCPERNFPSIGERMRRYVGWIESGCLVVRFEDLVGLPGGGTRARQQQTLQRVFGHLGVDCTEDTLHRIGNELFSAVSPTFRKGRIGGWREHFDPVLEDRFMELAGDSLLAYGYSAEPQAGVRAS